MTNKSYIPILAVLGAIMLVVVAAMAPPQSFFGRDFVHAQTPDDATLSALSLSGVTLSPTFNPAAATRTYSGRAASETNSSTVTATAANGNANVSIVPGDQDSTIDGHQVTLRGGQNRVITVRVVSEDRRVTETYTITVYQERTQQSADADLKVLGLSGVALSPAFASDKITYTGRAAYGTTETTVTTRADIGVESVAIAPADADDDTDGHQVTLAPGANTSVTVTVTPEDGSTAKVYTVTVYRENLVKSDNARLADSTGLSFTETVTGFTYAPDTMSYPNAKTANGVASVTVAASAAHLGAMRVITPSDQDPEVEGHQVVLAAGAKTEIMVKVTAEDGTTTETYSVTIYRARRVASDDADLSALSLSGVTLSPAFASDKITYTGRAAYDTNEPTVTTRADIGVESVAITPADADDDTDGHQVALTAGANTTVTVTVTAEDDSTNKVYTLTVYRENLVKSDNARLADSTGLSFTETVTGFAYAPDTMSYPDVRTDNDVASVTVTATPAHLGAMVVITPSDQDSVSANHQVVLPAGAKTAIMVEVTAEDGTTTETYSVTIYRERRVPSDDADLSALSLSGVMLSPAFASNKITYTGRAAHDTNEPTVMATPDIGVESVVIAPADADADTDGHQVALTAGANTEVTVTVTAEDDSTNKVYTLTVYRENLVKSDNARLADSGGLSFTETVTGFTYAPGTMSYPNVRTENDVAVVTVTASAAQPGAMVVITPSDQDSVSANHQVVLPAGAKTAIMVEVTAEDGTTTETYSVTIYRERRVPSDDADLSALSLSGVTLSPTFDPAKIDYTGTGVYNARLTTVMATPDIGATSVVIVPADANADVPGHQVALTRNLVVDITVTVTAEDETAEKTYTVKVYRDNAPSSDATLQSLTLSGITLSPAFDPATTAYTAEAEDIEMTMVEAMATHPGATVEGTGEMSLSAGENVISVTVTAEDETTQTYTVMVTVMGAGTLLDRYDADDSGDIDLTEVSAAIDDYFNGDLTLAQVSDVIDLYFG